MFRRSRILQAVLPALLTTACASQQAVEPIAAPNAPIAGHRLQADNAAPPSAPQSPARSGADLSPPPSLPDIQAGRSEASSRPFVAANGRLETDIQEFSAEVAQLRNVPLEHVQALLLDARYNATAARLMSPSKTRG
ncbi:MAG: lytic murein transglycosylase B, partial [Alcaligenaceae bacterium]|nr:lytic murein transglycosylase B [Alcaligenaceae bacterium]